MRWLGKLFRRKPAADPEQWEAGDIAECIKSGAWVNPDESIFLGGPKVGLRYRVVHVQERNWRGDVLLGLQFPAWGDRWFNSFMFRKVRPRADALEAGTATSIEDLRPVPVTPEKEGA